MKPQTILHLKFLSLSIIICCVTFGLYAQEKNSNLLSLNTDISKIKPLPKIKNTNQNKLATLDIHKISEDKRQLEEWMFDTKFWKVTKKFEWDKKPVEEPREIEEWMKNIKIQKVGCIDIYSDFVEKEWMKEHSFFIL